MSAENVLHEVRAAARSPYVLTRIRVESVLRVSPSFVRITFGGPGLADFGTPGEVFDQRIKLIFPSESGVLPLLDGAEDDDWYRVWLELPDEERGFLRTYSIRDLLLHDTDGTLVVVDFVLHLEPGLSGPASRWAAAAEVGSELVVAGPRRGRTDGGGIEYAPGDATLILLAGDETAAPAVARILEDVDASTRGCVFIEVPEAADELPIHAPAGVKVHWLPRGSAAHGTALIPAVLEYLGDQAALASVVIEDADTESPLWETPLYSGLGEELPAYPVPHGERYFWIAGESGVVTTLRRHLVKDLGIARSQVAFMGYWRKGVAMRA